MRGAVVALSGTAKLNRVEVGTDGSVCDEWDRQHAECRAGVCVWLPIIAAFISYCWLVIYAI